ncbi:MAG: hypothetical protein ACJ8ET_03245 [Sphingomicrobium sp.]
MTKCLSRRGFACALLATAALSPPVTAQIVPPPPHNARTATGVSYRGGAFSFEEVDLSVAGGLPNGLSLTRSYNSSTMPISEPYTSALGWTNNFDIYITSSQVPHYPGVEYPEHYHEACVYSVTGGASSVQFFTPAGETGTTYSLGCGGNVPDTYTPTVPTGQKLEFIAGSPLGHFEFTNSDGSKIVFTASGTAPPRASVWTMPDGTRLDFNYTTTGSNALKSVFSNRGWAVLFESAEKTCIVNTAETYVTALSTCPAGAQTATYTYGNGFYYSLGKILTGVTIGGNTRTYEYSWNDDHVSCIKDPGQSTCRIQNTYTSCPDDPELGYVQPSTRLHDPVTSQQDGSGRVYTYTYDTSFCPMSQRDARLGYPDYSYWSGATTSFTQTGVSGSTTATVDAAAQLTLIRDPLNRETAFGYDDEGVGAPDGLTQIVASGELEHVIFPEQNQLAYEHDSRGNQISSAAIAKPGTGLPTIATSSSFPETCSNIIICNKPTSVTDARNNVTDYTYDPVHGGVLAETKPAVNGVRPQTRYSYVQRSAWLRNSAGGYSASPYPVWLVSEMRTCRISATIDGVCAAGPSDEVVTSYDYGPNSGPNNLLLRGTVVTADGTSRRTCFSYDSWGNKIAETKPRAGLSTCP